MTTALLEEVVKFMLVAQVTTLSSGHRVDCCVVERVARPGRRTLVKPPGMNVERAEVHGSLGKGLTAKLGVVSQLRENATHPPRFGQHTTGRQR